jgi:hypothetical protein
VEALSRVCACGGGLDPSCPTIEACLREGGTHGVCADNAIGGKLRAPSAMVCSWVSLLPGSGEFG